MARDGLLQFEDGVVQLGGKIVPGILRSCTVGGSVRFDEAEMDFMSGASRTPLGWDDGEVELTLDLLTDEAGSCYDKLAELNAAFKGYDNGGNPKVYDVASSHVRARGIRQVVFVSLRSQETDEDDVIQAMLKFLEHRPAIIDVERRKGSASSTPVVAAAPAGLSASLGGEEGPGR